MIKLYFTLQSCTKVQEQFQRRYADVYLSKMAVQQLLPVFMRQEVYRTSRNLATICVVCRKTWRYVGVAATFSKKKSEKLASQVQMPYSITQKAVRKLHLCAYCIRALQELKVWIQQSGVQYFRWFQSFSDRNGINMLDMFYFSDRAWFHLYGYTNRLAGSGQVNIHTQYMKNPHIHKKLVYGVCLAGS